MSSVQYKDIIYRGVKSGRLRKLATKLYTKNLKDAPEAIVKRHLWQIVGDYFPHALIADRTALENSPAEDGSICLITEKGNDVVLPGIKLRPRRGWPPIKTDLPFINGLFMSSTARAYLENMRFSRAREGAVPRTLTKNRLEERLDKFIRLSGESAVNKLRDEVLALAEELKMPKEGKLFNEMVGALLGTKEASLDSSLAIARSRGRAYDPERLMLFQTLYAALRDTPSVPRPIVKRTKQAQATLAFFDAYFSNFIEGTEFEVDEAASIVFKNFIPKTRPEDAHDVLGTWRIVSSDYEMQKRPKDYTELVEILTYRHALIMQQRLDKEPGKFKQVSNRFGNVTFVEPELVDGTLRAGFELCQGLETAFHRAVFMMFLISEVHPFLDGNGRTARIMMNAELVANGEERIIIPTVYRNNYLSALNVLSQGGYPEALIRTLDFAQKWVASVEWDELSQTQAQLESRHAFLQPNVAEAQGKRLI